MFDKKYKKGYAEGGADTAKPYEAFGQKQADAIQHILEEFRQGKKDIKSVLKELNGSIDGLYDHLQSKEKENLYTVYTPFDIKKLEPEARLFLVGALFRLTTDKVPNENQQNYIRAVQKYLELKDMPIGVDLGNIANIEEPAAQKAIFQAVLEYLCLQDGDCYDETELQHNFLEDFDLSPKKKREITEYVELLYIAVGAKGLAEKYGYVPEEEPEQEENKQAFEEARQSLNETIRSLGSLEIRLSFDGYFEKTTVKIVSNLLNNQQSGGENSILEPIFEEELKDDIKAGAIKAKAVADRIEESMKNENGFVAAYKFIVTDENFEEKKYYFFIITDEGFFFFLDCKIAFIKFDDLKSVKEARSSIAGNSITISARQVIYYEEDGTEGESDKIVIEKNNDNKDYLRGFRKGLEHVIEKFGGTVPSAEDEVAKIVEKYINKISKNTENAYLVKDFKYDSDDSKNMKRLKNALATYALKVRKDEAIGFIDTTLRQNGKDGILFAKDGIAFDSAFTKVFARYEEIDSMSIEKNTLYLHGHFSECDKSVLYVTVGFINLGTLKDCLEEIKCVI